MNPVLKNIHVQIHTRDAIHCLTENLNLLVHESSLRMIEDFVVSLNVVQISFLLTYFYFIFSI